mgnify:CR=1 FL=1
MSGRVGRTTGIEKVCDAFGHFALFAETAHGGSPVDGGHIEAAGLRQCACRLVHDIARRDGVYPNAALCPFDRLYFGESDERGFGNAIGPAPRCRDLAQAQSNEVTSLSVYQKARTQLEQVTAQTLAVANVDLSEAMSGQVKREPDALPPGQ